MNKHAVLKDFEWLCKAAAFAILLTAIVALAILALIYIWVWIVPAAIYGAYLLCTEETENE